MKKIIVLFVSIFLVTGCSLLNNETVENSKVNNNTDIIKEQVVGNFKLDNVSLTYFNGTSTFNVNVTNNTDRDINISRFNIIFKSQSGSVITTINGYVGSNIGPNETLEATMTSDVDLSNAYSVEYDID